MTNLIRIRCVCCLVFLVFWGVPIRSQCEEAMVNVNEAIANIKEACSEYRRTFMPLRLFMKQERREAYNEEYQEAEICLKTKDEHCQGIEIIYSSESTAHKVVVCKNDKYSFEIRNGSADSEWVVDDILPSNSTTLESSLGHQLSLLDTAIYAPAYVNNMKLDDFLESPAVVVTNIEANGEDILIKTHIADPEEEISGNRIGFFEVELFIRPHSTGWLPYRYIRKTRMQNNRVFARIVDFSDYKKENGIFVPQKVVTIVQEDNRDPWRAEIATFRWSSRDALSDSEFTLSHYGLPEPDFGERRTNWVRYTLMAAGIILIAFALWQMYRERIEGKS